MFIELLDKLVDRIIQLKTEQKQEARLAFANFFEPVHKIFEDVHLGLLKDLRRYKAAVDDTPGSIEGLIKTLADDRLFDDTLRLKLVTAAANSDWAQAKDYFIDVYLYLGIPTNGFLCPIPSQQHRANLIEDLQRILRESPRDEIKSEALLVVEGIAKPVMRQYSNVEKSYLALQKKMLA